MFRGTVILLAALFALALIWFEPTENKRIALVVDNADEFNAAQMSSRSKNVNDIARALRSSGFEVIQGRKLNYKELRRHIQRFAKRIEAAELAVFYFTGRLVQEHNRNYLIPANAKLRSLADAEFQWVRLDPLLRQMQLQAKGPVILLDACRSMDHHQNRTSPGRILVVSPCPALAPIKTGKKILIAYGSGTHGYVIEKRQRNSPFTQALLDQLAQPNKPIADAVVSASAAVKGFAYGGAQPRKPGAIARDTATKTKTIGAPAPASLNAAADRPMIASSRPARTAENNEDKKPNLMSRTIRIRLQKALARMGCFRRTINGVWDTASRQALARFIRVTHSTPPTKMPEPRLLRYLSRFSGPICATQCAPHAKDDTDRDCASGSRQRDVAGSTVPIRIRALYGSNRSNRRLSSKSQIFAYGARRRISPPDQVRSPDNEKIGVRVWGIHRSHNPTIGRKLGYQRRITFDVNGGSVSYTKRVRATPGP